MYYAIYKNIRAGAWKCLVDFQIDRLPVDVLKIARTANIRVIRDSSVHVLRQNEDGKSFYDGQTWIIVYNDSQSTARARTVIAHELGHIFLGHDLIFGKYPQVNEFFHKPKSEHQADQFALRLLCPSCILWGLHLQQASDIAQYCRVERELAQKRAARMKMLYERKKFLTDPLEKAVYLNFQAYLKQEVQHAPHRPPETETLSEQGETHENRSRLYSRIR